TPKWAWDTVCGKMNSKQINGTRKWGRGIFKNPPSPFACKKLIVLIQPFFHQLYITVIVLYKAHMSAGTEQFPLSVRDPVIHIFCNVRCTQIVSAVDHQSRLLDVF